VVSEGVFCATARTLLSVFLSFIPDGNGSSGSLKTNQLDDDLSDLRRK